jgi:hypothetical protein
MPITQQKAENQTLKTDCSAFCPVCGADLYFTENECICKNKECSWSCKECKKED